jgi:hypothetical protein
VLATTVRGTVAPQSLEMDGARHSAACKAAWRIARLVCTFEHAKPLPAKSKHLGHKRQVLELTALIERLKDFLLAAHFDPITRTKL